VNGSGDDGYEMPGPDPLDDDAIDGLIAGTNRDPGAAGTSAFIEGLRSAAVAVPTPSPVLAAAIAAGGISTNEPPVASWRKWRMKIQGFLAGLGVAGKVALGVGVAAAATTGAGVAGVLPGPVQHAVSQAVDAVSPFSVPDGGHHDGGDGKVAEGDGTTTTTFSDVTTTTKPKEHDGTGEGDGNVIVTPTTVEEHHGSGDTTSTTVAHDGSGSHDGEGDNNETPTTVHQGEGDDNETPTTVRNGDGDNNNPESLTIHCERLSDGARISCTWSAATNEDHVRYVLLRTGDGYSRVVRSTEDGLSFIDTVDLSLGTVFTYTYRVDSLRADNSVAAHSPAVNVVCCSGSATTTTTVSENHDGTTTTTVGEVH
jgi:hypothetical protein